MPYRPPVVIRPDLSPDHPRLAPPTQRDPHRGRSIHGAWGFLRRQHVHRSRQRSSTLWRPAAPSSGIPLPPPALAPARPAPPPGNRCEVSLRQRSMPRALAEQLGVGYTASGSWPHAGPLSVRDPRRSQSQRLSTQYQPRSRDRSRQEVSLSVTITRGSEGRDASHVNMRPP